VPQDVTTPDVEAAERTSIIYTGQRAPQTGVYLTAAGVELIGSSGDLMPAGPNGEHIGYTLISVATWLEQNPAL
jgi:hypothetical protein